MTYKLSDAQLIMMSTAAQRNDRCLMPSETLKGAALSKLTSKFIRLGLVREAKAKAGMPVWRRDDDGNGFALKLTAAGLKAIAIEGDRGPAGEPCETLMIEPEQIAAHSAIGSAPTTREPPRGQQARLGARFPSAARGRDGRTADRSHGLVATYDASRPHWPAQARLFGGS